MTRVCVFCGSSAGVRPDYAQAARDLAAELSRRRLGLVYGGGGVGIMGVLADAALAAGVEVTGVIPRPLARRELAHRGVSDLRLVDSMHERKATMAGLADGFIALPGGLGTLEEILEILTWAQLGIHSKPVAALNTAGYWHHLIELLGHAVAEQFLRPEYAGLLLFADTPAELLERMLAWRPPDLPRAWLSPSQT